MTQDFEQQVWEALAQMVGADGMVLGLHPRQIVLLAPRVAAAITAAIDGERTRLTKHGGHISDVEKAALAALRGETP